VLTGIVVIIVIIVDASSIHRKNDIRGVLNGSLSEDRSLMSSGPGIAVQKITKANKGEQKGAP
jgi:hypothetical protein